MARRMWACAAMMVISGCSLTKLTVDQTAGVLNYATRALETENDLELAEASIPGSLKTIEGFLQAHQEQPILLRLLAEGYLQYGFGFLEDEAERYDDDDPDRAEHLRKRAGNLYRRSRGFALRLLAQQLPELAATLGEGKQPSEAQLAAVGEDEVEALFWVANPWAAEINVSKDKPEMLAQLSLVQSLMERVAAIDEGFYRAGPRFALGAMAAGVPQALGGNPDHAKKEFGRAIELTKGEHLMYRVLMARQVGLQSADKAYFKKGLEEALSVDPDINPDLALANRLAQRRARRYLSQIDDLFL